LFNSAVAIEPDAVRRTESKNADSGRKSNDKPAFTPVDLELVPAVDELLDRLGMGAFVRDSLEAPTGRNDVWTGSTTSGRKVFVKRLVGNPDEVDLRMGRLLSFERFSEQSPASERYGPRLLGSDGEAKLVAYEFVEDARGGANLVVDEDFDDDLAYATGRLIGRLHETKGDASVGIDETPPSQPSVELLYGLPSRMFDNISFGELSAWRLLQQDKHVVSSVESLRKRERDAPAVPAHCDLRIDQFMVTEDKIYLTDWEEFRQADGARDVGDFAGEWLYRSVLDIITDRGDDAFIDVELTHEMVLERGVRKMERLLPRVRCFWRGYREIRPRLDDEFGVRATAFAGWHLLDRLIAASARSARLSAIERAAAGVGRSALVQPEKFVGTIGFGEQS
jgi:hypothetical protein